MKKFIVVLLTIGIAAPAAWGLYSYRSPQAPPMVAESPAIAPGGLLAPLQRFNDWAIALKRKLNAYVRRDQRAATEGWAQKCLPRIADGLYARTGQVSGQRITSVAGTIYNVSDADRPPAAYRLKLYDKSGGLIATRETRIGAIRAHSSRPFRAFLNMPGAGVASAKLELDAIFAHH